MKYTVVIDTSSYVNLSQDDCYSARTLLKLLSEISTIRFSSLVNRIEIANHYNTLMPKSIERVSNVYFLKKIKTYKEYELKLFDFISDNNSKNRGEKHNLAVILDHYLDRKKLGLVYLTDDNSALNGCLKDAIYAFPLYQIWNSFDVILYLYIESKRFTKDLAEAAIRDMNAIMATDNMHMHPEKTQERIRIVRSYLQKIQRISKTLG